MKLLPVLFLCLASFTISGQQSDPLQSRILSPKEMKEDLAIYQKLLRETHPGLFRYQTEDQFRKAIDSINTQIIDPLPFYDFYRLLARLSSGIRCAHTQLFPSENIMQSLKESYSVFPFFLYPIEERLYVLFSGMTDDSVQPGSEIISINNKSVAEIRENISKYYYRDGHNEPVLRRFLQGGMFSLYYYLAVEQPGQFNVVLQDPEGKKITLQVPAMPYAEAERNYVKNPVNARMMSYYNRKNKNWDWRILEEVPSTAYLRIESFGAPGVDTQDDAQESFQKFMDKAMKKINGKNMQHLIVELRGNGGGWDILGKELLSYLLKSDEAVPYYAEQSTVTVDSEFLKYADFSAEDLEKARKHMIPRDDGTFRVGVEGNPTLLPQEPKENRFRGNVYILTDAQCASTCAEFTAVAKANGAGILVGEESGGAWEGGNGGSFISYTLPNSGIYSNTPLVKYTMAVTPAAAPGRGTIPDHQVVMTLEDILNGRDAQKELVFDLIRQQE